MKRTIKRLPHARVNAQRPLRFRFDGQGFEGVEGDTLASALLANGQSVIARSFKLHRPRGVFASGKEETNAFVQLEPGPYTEPNARATLTPLYDGLCASGQNAWPNVRRDLGGCLGAFKAFLPASFYYKTFMWPNWRTWEGLVRRLAGLGRAPEVKDPQTYVKQNIHADVVVVGGGRSGIKAALEAAGDPKARVLLLDDQEELGGARLASPRAEDWAWLEQAKHRLANHDNITVLCRTTVNAYYVNDVLAALERLTNHHGPGGGEGPRERLWRIFAKRVVLATGAMERPLVFPNNDRPGIMLASAVRDYTHRYGLTLGDNIVFYANNDSAWRTALELVEFGVPVASIIDIRQTVDRELIARAAGAAIKVHLASAVVDTIGRDGVRRVLICKLLDGGKTLRRGAVSIDCDLLAMSGGWSPTAHLFSQAGGRLAYREADGCFIPTKTEAALTVVGRANGDFDEPLNTKPQWLTPDCSPSHQWVDFQYDVTASDIHLAARENFVSVEHVKRYTTNGMSIDQGKTSNVNGLAILSEVVGRRIDEVGTTRFRPPYHPTTIGAFAGVGLGEIYAPFQRLPAHDAHVAAGALFEDYGAWKRPVYYPRPGETEAMAIEREALAVRQGVGLLDYSPLGKLEIVGPDAQTFLNRIYLNNIETMKVGQARYGLVLNEGGIVIDDGVLVRLTEQRFLVHTTSGGVGAIQQHMERWLQTEWPELRVLVINATSQWATLMLTGPKARDVLLRLSSDIDLSAEAFKHMQFREGTLNGWPCRILRASFTGEVSFEISVPARHGRALWDALIDAGQADGVIPFGLESLMLLRTEKGYLHVGADTDGNTMPQDLGWALAIAKKPADFIGRRSLSQSVGLDPDRFQFTGIELDDPAARVTAGAHVLSADHRTTAGYVTSAYFSPTLGRTVALGLVAGAQNRQGQEVEIVFGGARQRGRLVKPGAYDPKGEILNG